MARLPKFLFPNPNLVTDFTIHNLPYGVFKHGNSKRAGVAIGDKILDLYELADANRVDPCLKNETLNDFMSKGKEVWRETRATIKQMLSDDHPNSLAGDQSLLNACIRDQKDVEMVLPARIGDYTDFYASREHATNLGAMFRDPTKPLLPNWLHIPVGYHGRASSVQVSGVDFHRPYGQKTTPDNPEVPVWGDSKSMDVEVEVGMFIGPGNELGRPISLENAEDHMFGLVLCNDWSARDIQKWEYVPLGPFLGKNFLTTISPWIVPIEALEPFRLETAQMKAIHAGTATPPLDYVSYKGDGGSRATFDIDIQLGLQTSNMNEPEFISHTNLKYMWWSFAQMITHHSSNGCNLRPGDLLASGTISGSDRYSYDPSSEYVPGADRGSYGSLMEITWGGKHDIELKSGETRKFLQDGDSAVMRAKCEKGDISLGFGDCVAKVLPPSTSTFGI